MYRMLLFSSLMVRCISDLRYFDSVQEQPQWEDYLRSYPRLIDQLNSIHNMMWVGIELSDEGKFVYGDDVLDTVNEFDFVYTFLKFLRCSGSMMDHHKSMCENGIGRFAHHTLALVISELFTWDTVSCKEHIYDKLIFDLYSYGRSSS
jgi:hypothetical protein